MHRTTQALRLMMVMVRHHFIEKFWGFEAMAVDMLTTTGPVAGATFSWKLCTGAHNCPSTDGAEFVVTLYLSIYTAHMVTSVRWPHFDMPTVLTTELPPKTLLLNRKTCVSRAHGRG